MKDILLNLSKRCFIGDVRQAAEYAYDMLRPLCDEISTDPTGSITAVINGKTNRKIMLEAHIDEIGMVVTSILDNGFIRAAKVGGVDIRVLPSCHIIIHAKQDVHGVFTSTPPHLAKEKSEKFSDMDELMIDTGLDNAKDIIKPGDYITFDVEPAELLGDYVTGKSMDNRTSCAALIRTAELIHQNGTPENTIIFLLASGEELGNRGAAPAAFAISPDEAVAVDVSFGISPGAPAEHCGTLGKGAMLGISPMLSKAVTDKLEAVAEKNNIAYQTEVMGGRTSTDADVISIAKSGIPCGLLSIPLRYMHTPIETVKLSDIETVAQILFHYSAEA